MKTYEELLEVIEDEKKAGEFCVQAVKDFEASEDYQNAYIADQYYHKHNVTIENFVKWLYTATGRKIQDIYSANYKLQTPFFRLKVIQHANYLLGNGVQLSKPEQKDRLGKNFDYQVQRLCKIAQVEGRAFGFWNVDHLEVFGYCYTKSHAGFCPLYSDDTGELMAGIRFWRREVGKKKINFYTLYTVDGITEYRQKNGEEIECIKPRYCYKKTIVRTQGEGILSTEESNYGSLPIIPMYASDTYESELVGHRQKIDCHDLVLSGFANNVDDASEIYWIIRNAGGMKDADLAKFLQKIKTTHAFGVNSEEGEDAEPKTVDMPTEARQKLLEILRTDIYDSMMLLDRRSMSAAQKTQQELDMAYQPQDDYINDLEFFVYEFLDRLFELVGMGDVEATMTRNKVANKSEQTTQVLSAANYISPECVIAHLPFLTPEEKEEEIKKMADDLYNKMHAEEELEEDEEGEELDE